MLFTGQLANVESQATECPFTPMWANMGEANMETVDKLIFIPHFLPTFKPIGGPLGRAGLALKQKMLQFSLRPLKTEQFSINSHFKKSDFTPKLRRLSKTFLMHTVVYLFILFYCFYVFSIFLFKL